MKSRAVPQTNATTEEIEAAVTQVQAALDGQEQRLIDLLRGLPKAETAPGLIPYQTTIPTMAHVIMRMAQRDLRGPSPSTQNKAVAKIIAALNGVVDVPIAYDPHGPDLATYLPPDLHLKLVGLRFAASQLAADIEIHAQPQKQPRGQRGRKPNEAAQEIVAYLAQEYERLTGNIPRRPNERPDRNGHQMPRGAFYDLVAETFEVLGIKASAATTIDSVLPTAEIGPKKNK